MPRKIPRVTGETNIIHGRLQDAVKNGFPEVGWPGDPLLEVRFSNHKNRWEIYDLAVSTDKPAVTKPFDGLRDLQMIPSICRKLNECRIDGVHSVVDRMQAHNDMVAQQNNAKTIAIAREGAEALAWAVAKDIDAGRL